MSLERDLCARLHGKVVLLGVGNRLRGDDAAGSLLARWLAERGLPAFDGEEVPENLLGDVVSCAPDTVLLVDAVDLGHAPGAVALLTPDQLWASAASTHRTPVSLLAEYIANRSGADVVILAIQPERIELGAGVSESVSGTLRFLSGFVERLLRDLPVSGVSRPLEGQPSC